MNDMTLSAAHQNSALRRTGKMEGWMLLGLLVLAAHTQVQAIPIDFSGDFAPSQWFLDAGNSLNPGSFLFLDYTGPDSAQNLEITGSTTDGPSITSVAMVYGGSANVTLSFDWTLVANGNNGPPDAFLYVNVNTTHYLLNPGLVTGIAVPAGATLSFELVSDVEKLKAPAKLTITGWDVDTGAVTVPDSLSGFGLVPLLGILGFHAFWQHRRNQKAGAVGPKA